jgi:hypothetical protein
MIETHTEPETSTKGPMTVETVLIGEGRAFAEDAGDEKRKRRKRKKRKSTRQLPMVLSSEGAHTSTFPLQLQLHVPSSLA